MSEHGVTVLMDSAKKVSLLSRDEEFALAAKMRSGNAQQALDARNQLVSANIRFVTHLAHGFVKSSDTSLEDYVSAGLEAMVKNADKFDPTKANFCTFIKPWIKKAFQELHYGNTAVAVPRYQHIKINRVLRASERLVSEHGPFADITNEMIADAANMTLVEVEDCLALHAEFLSHTPSLDTPVGDDDGVTLLDTVANDYTVVEAEDFSEPMQAALSALTPEEAQVIMMTAGLDGDADMSNTEIAEAMGITAAKVRSLLASARTKMADFF